MDTEKKGQQIIIKLFNRHCGDIQCLMMGKGAVNNVLDHLIYHTLVTKQHNGTLGK